MSDTQRDHSQLAELVANLRLHQHLCLIYDTPEEQFAAALPYLRLGLERGEKCIYVADENTAAAVLDALHESGTDVSRHLRSGALAIFDRYETYFQRGTFDSELMIRFWREAAREAARAKFSGLRGLGEMTWVLGVSEGAERLIGFESKLNHVVCDHDVALVCQYNRAHFPPEIILGVLRTHPLVVCGARFAENPYYVPPDEFLKPSQVAVEVDRLLKNILEWERAEERLRQSEADFAAAQRVAKLGTWRFDAAAGTVRWSEELYRIFDIEKAAFGGSYESFLSRVHPDDQPRVIETNRKAIASGEPFNLDYRILTPGGELKNIRETGYGTKDARGSVVALFGTAQDITEGKRAEDELESSRDRLRALAGRLQHIREEERTSVAREIHDELGSALTGIKLDLSSLARELGADQKQQIEAILAGVDETIQSVRRISSELRPAVLDAVGLVAALEWAGEEFEARTGTRCRLNLPAHDVVVNPERATAIFRIFQETLTNVARHARATEVHVRLAQADHSLTLEVQDNGSGVSEEQVSAGSSLGVLGMRERALFLGGELTIVGTPGKGTTVRARIPETEPDNPEDSN
jgi:two-component system, NarL family, sensor histidine kinase UhpB